jgi:hypothetical protein
MSDNKLPPGSGPLLNSVRHMASAATIEAMVLAIKASICLLRRFCGTKEFNAIKGEGAQQSVYHSSHIFKYYVPCTRHVFQSHRDDALVSFPGIPFGQVKKGIASFSYSELLPTLFFYTHTNRKKLKNI